MEKQQGYSMDYCRRHCEKAAQDWSEFSHDLESDLEKLNLQETLSKRFLSLHVHNIPKIALAGCPNGCSQPQIKDIGVIGFVKPQLSLNPCCGCRSCISVCLEKAVTMETEGITLKPDRCVACGECIRHCPTQRIVAQESGWNLTVGGRLGRHPQLARSVGHVATGEEVKHWILSLLQEYRDYGLPGERFSHYLERKKGVMNPIVHEPNFAAFPCSGS